MTRKIAFLATAVVVSTVVVATVLGPQPLFAEDWNIAAERGVTVSVYIETDENTDTVVRRQARILTGAESVAFDCLSTDLDCGFSLLDSCSAIEASTGFIDFINHSYIRETCISGHGQCLYAKGFLFTNSGGQLQMIATTTTLQTTGSCSPH